MLKLIRFTLVLFFASSFASLSVQAQEHTVAREWNEVLLSAIRDDFARPTVHARNLFHTSVVMYDSWAAYNQTAIPYFLGRTHGGDFTVPFEGVAALNGELAAEEEAMSYACYRLLTHRFQDSPNQFETQQRFDLLMDQLGYDPSYTDTDYQNGNPAAFGNYLGEQMILFGLQDGSNEQGEYTNTYYEPVNPELEMDLPGNPNIVDPNRWQPLGITDFIDQSGEPITGTLPFLSPEWGNVDGFAIDEGDLTTYSRNGDEYRVFHDPLDPPYHDPNVQTGLEDNWKWGFCLVAIWSGHCGPSPEEDVIWDISPASIGNIPDLPETFEDFPSFYNLLDGGDISQGHDINPATGQPYTPQYVPRGDYARILAEFWADGPDSETPPGHWFTILNYVNDHPMLEKRWMGEGPILDDLEWDVKTYFTLGGAMHDAAISAWSVKGWYDYIRPVSAIRYMAEKGQSSDPNLPSYDPAGFPLVPGYIELVEAGDPLAGPNNENVGEIKLYAWKGPDYIEIPELDQAGVDWILAKEWWPYQRPSFVTPPFAGYVSGHSTYSRAAADIFTAMTGDPYFPGGMGEFQASQNSFLVFEEGPTIDVTLQWATYRDASDQCSLSRIWGGIHPPADDIPGRKIGIEVAIDAFNLANQFINPDIPRVLEIIPSDELVSDIDNGEVFTITANFSEAMNTSITPSLSFLNQNPIGTSLSITGFNWDDDQNFTWTFLVNDVNESLENIVLQVNDAVNLDGEPQALYTSGEIFLIDTENPSISNILPSTLNMNDATVGGLFSIDVIFSEAMLTLNEPDISFPGNDLSSSLMFDDGLSLWVNDTTYRASYTILDGNVNLLNVAVSASNSRDAIGNLQLDGSILDVFSIDTENPEIVSLVPNSATVNDDLVGTNSLTLTINFSEDMNINEDPMIEFSEDLSGQLIQNNLSSFWAEANQYVAVYDVVDNNVDLGNIDVIVSGLTDGAFLNPMATQNLPAAIVFDTENPFIEDLIPSDNELNDDDAGVAALSIPLSFNENMDTSMEPVIEFIGQGDIATALTLNTLLSAWQNNNTYLAVFNLDDTELESGSVTMSLSGLSDMNGNSSELAFEDLLLIDTKNPNILFVNANTYLVGNDDLGEGMFNLLIIYDEAMGNANPLVQFPDENPLSGALSPNAALSGWINATTYNAVYDVNAVITSLSDIDVQVILGQDLAGNNQEQAAYADYFNIEIDSSVTVEEMLEAPAAYLYPNPVAESGVISLQCGNLSGSTALSIVNMSGQLVQSDIIQLEKNSVVAIETSALATGMYLLVLAKEDQQTTLRFQVK